MTEQVSVPETTLCWKCSKQYLMWEIKCPHCDAGNANFAFAAPTEQRTAAQPTQPPELSDAEIKTVPPTCMITMGDDELTALLPDGNSGSYTEEIIERLISQAKRANALAAEVERLRMWKLRAEAAETQEAHETACKEEAERRCDAAVAALKCISDNHDHDADAHKYETSCRVCVAEAAIKECGK